MMTMITMVEWKVSFLINQQSKSRFIKRFLFMFIVSQQVYAIPILTLLCLT